MKNSFLKISKFFIGWPLSIVALYFIWINVSSSSTNIFSKLLNISPTLFIFGILCFIIFFLLRGFIWYRLLLDHIKDLKFAPTIHHWSVSELKRYIPGKFWFVLGRASAFSGPHLTPKAVATQIIYELEIFTLSAIAASLLSLPFIQKYFFPQFNLSIFYPFITFGFILILFFFIYNSKLLIFLPKILAKFMRPILPGNSPKTLINLIIVSTIAFIFFGLGNYFLITSISFLDPQLIPQLIGFFALSFLIGFLSFITPSGLGVREGVMSFGLSKMLTFAQASFAALFVRVILTISELIFVLLTYFISKTKNAMIIKIINFIKKNPQVSILFVLIFIYIIYFSYTSFFRYDHFYTGRFDLGNMAQTVWNTSQGRIFELTNPNSIESISRLAFHADFILIFFAPFYFIWESPKLLLLIQSVVIGIGALFVYLIAKKKLQNKNLALVFAFAYLLNPSLQRANIYDFHAVALVPTFLLGAFYFMLQKKYKFFAIFAVLAAFTKEQIWLTIALFGLYILLIQKKRVLGITTTVLSCTIFYFLIWHAMPASLGTQHFALSYFSDFGDSPGQIIKTTIFSPNKIIGTILLPDRIIYLNQLFLPIGFLSIFSPLYLIFAAQDFLINLLSSNNNLHQIYYQYTSTLTPFIFISSIMGVAFVKKTFKFPDVILITYLVIFSITGAFLYGPLPGSLEPNLAMYNQPQINKELIDSYLSKIPNKSSVASTNNLGSHLSHREKIYTVPNGINNADFVLFLLSSSSSAYEKEIMLDLMQNSLYNIVYKKDDFIVFQKKQ